MREEPVILTSEICSTDGTWFLSEYDLSQPIYIITPTNAEGNITFNFTAVTKEDGTEASASAQFTVEIQQAPGPGNGTIVPLPTIMEVRNNTALEDRTLVLNISLSSDPSETTNVTHSLVIYNLNSNLTISGEAYYNVYTGTWVMSKASLDAGRVFITAPKDFSGTYDLVVQAVASNTYFETTETANQTIALRWTPDGDGPKISATAKSENLNSTGLMEDNSFTLNVTMAEIDVDGSETIGEWVIIEFGAGYNVSWSYNFTGLIYSFGPFVVDGIPIAYGINISTSLLDKLKMIPMTNWHGKIPITIHGFTTEFLDPSVVGWSQEDFEFEVIAVADRADLFANSTITVPEFIRTSIASLLSASRTDVIEVNGKEMISVKLLNVPDGSQFFLPGSTTRYGGFVEPGVYSIPDATKLPLLEFLGPEFVSGSFNVTLSAVTVESSNFDEFTTETTFTLVMNPVASGFLILSKDIAVNSSGIRALDLNVRVLDNQGYTYPGEDPPETVELYFTFPATAGNNSVFLRPTLGGHLSRTANGNWTFRGTEKQANAIEVVNVGASGVVAVDVVGRTLDVGAVSTLSTDDFSFKVTFTQPNPLGNSSTVVGASQNGTAGNDFYFTTAGSAQEIWGNGGADIFFNSQGAKTMTGGSGADQFVWPDAVSITGGLDRIKDFNSAEGDQLNLGGLLNFNVQTGIPSNYVKLNGSTLQVSADGSGTGWIDVVILDGVFSFNATDLYVRGNLLL
jgi:hypothetical protein